MRYTSASAFRQALETRLLALSREEGVTVVRLRKQVAFDRLLARILLAAPGRWVLKGGLALAYRFGTRARSTRDMDLAGSAGEDTATADLLAAQDLDLGDYFGFTIERTAKLDELVEGSAVRYHVRADLGGRRFEDFVVDVGFDLPSGWETEMLKGTDLLAFAGIDAVEAPSLALELQVAEKVHAYTRGYGPEGIRSTRVKDIVDLTLIASTVSLDAERLQRALRETFGRRGGHDLPTRSLLRRATGTCPSVGWLQRSGWTLIWRAAIVWHRGSSIRSSPATSRPAPGIQQPWIGEPITPVEDAGSRGSRRSRLDGAHMAVDPGGSGGGPQ